MSTELPRIAKTVNRLLVMIEQAVRGFGRHNKFMIGADLRRDAMKVYRCVDRAWHEPQRRVMRLRELSAAVDDLRLTLQAAKQIEAFRSFGQFEAIAREVTSLGRQCGGWLKQVQGRSQSGPAASAAGQRAQILSAHPAHEART